MEMNVCLNNLTYLLFVSVAQRWESWEMLLNVEIFVDTLGWKSAVLSLVGLHLGNEVDEMLWLFE